MTFKKTALTVGIAFVALAGSAAAALAASAVATDNVNVRSGPGSSYGVVDNLRRGERVEIDQCRGSWCLVYNNGTEGWVAASYLGGGSVGPVRPSRPVGVDINIGIGGGYGGGHHGGNWGNGGGWGNGGYYGRPHGGNWGNRGNWDGGGRGGVGFYFGN